MLYKLAVLVSLLTIVGRVSAFWELGHLTAARIAYDYLSFSKQGQYALQKANDMLQVYKDAFPDMVLSEYKYPFVECATFADEIKLKNMTWQSNWHFIDTPYLDEGGSLDDFPGFIYDPNSIDKAIISIMNWIQNKGMYQNSFVYSTIMQNLGASEAQSKSFALRLLIHYIGDLHQPLHATARINKRYPKGDAGGNFFKVPEINGAKNLHSVWDSILYVQNGTASLPFSYSDWLDLGKYASKLESTYTFSTGEWQNLDVAQWTQDSFELSKTNVYAGIKEGQPLSQDYINKNQYVIQRQIVLGGLRLANVILSLFPMTETEEQSLFLQ